MLCCCIMLPLALLHERHSSRPDGLTAPFGVVRVEQTTTAAAAPPAASCGRTRLRPAEALSSSGSGFAASAPASFRERRPCQRRRPRQNAPGLGLLGWGRPGASTHGRLPPLFTRRQAHCWYNHSFGCRLLGKSAGRTKENRTVRVLASSCFSRAITSASELTATPLTRRMRYPSSTPATSAAPRVPRNALTIPLSDISMPKPAACRVKSISISLSSGATVASDTTGGVARG